MEADFSDFIPCSSIAVDSVLRLSTAGVIWGSCYSPFDAKKLGLSGSSQALHIVKSVGKCGFSFGNRNNALASFGNIGCCVGHMNLLILGLFAAIFSFSRCGIQRYRQQKDWVNTLSAGVIAGAAFGARNRNWKQVAGITGLFCTCFQYVNDSKSV